MNAESMNAESNNHKSKPKAPSPRHSPENESTNAGSNNDKSKPKAKPRVQIFIEHENQDLTLDEWLKKNNKEFDINALMRKNVLMLTRHFDFRLKMFVKHIMMGQNNPMHSKYFTYRIEFQSRGAGHAHGLLWLFLHAG